MKKLLLLLCLLASVVTAQAQFEKGKWIVNPSVTGLGLSYDTQVDKASFGLDVNGGVFMADNLALLVRAGLSCNEGADADTDVYSLGVGGRVLIRHGSRLRFLPFQDCDFGTCAVLEYQ